FDPNIADSKNIPPVKIPGVKYNIAHGIAKIQRSEGMIFVKLVFVPVFKEHTIIFKIPIGNLYAFINRISLLYLVFSVNGLIITKYRNLEVDVEIVDQIPADQILKLGLYYKQLLLYP